MWFRMRRAYDAAIVVSIVIMISVGLLVSLQLFGPSSNLTSTTTTSSISTTTSTTTTKTTPTTTTSITTVIPAVPSFFWNISVGDSFNYSCDSWGDTEGGDIYPSLESDILELDGGIINVTITSLPDLEGVNDSISFMNRVLKYTKVTCTLIKESTNVTSVPGLLRNAISLCILPVGSWGAIERFYPQAIYDWTTAPDYYASRLYETYLYLGWEYCGYDDCYNINGNVQLNNGVPSMIQWSYDHMGEIHISLELI